MKIKITIFSIIFISSCLFFADVQLTSAETFDYRLLEPIFSDQRDQFIHFTDYLQSIYKFAVWTVGIAALLMISIGGFMYMTSAGNQANAETAKRLIRDALFGLVMVLFSWVLLNLINPDLVNIDLNSIKKLHVEITNAPVGAGPGAPRAVPIDMPPLSGDLPQNCDGYAETFAAAGAGTPGLDCFLTAIASQESGCRPGVASSAGACGLMQFLPSTAGKSCDWLKTHPHESIHMAADYFRRNQSTLNGYKGSFDIGDSFQQSPGKTVTVGGYTYNAANDDLIASYNAGAGTRSGTKIGSFAPSKSCFDRDGSIPVWQCDINTPGYSETRNYVRAVQNFQNICERGK